MNDKDNKEALQIWAEKGLEASIQHMFRDQKTGNTISYARHAVYDAIQKISFEGMIYRTDIGVF